jgi:hypothetical protein
MRAWLGLSIGVLVAAGAFAVGLVFARMPPFDTWVTDPAFFRRVLVYHVDLALVAWFVSFAAGLLFLLPARGRTAAHTHAGVWLAAGGLLAMALAVAMPGAAPILANYVPMIDHPLFAGGQLLFGAGVLTSLADGRLLAPGATNLPAAAVPGLRATGIAILLAAVTLGGSVLTRPVGASPEVFWERLNWGVGHTLQLVSVTAMVSVWLILAGESTGRAPMRRATSSALFAALLLPWMAAPLLAMAGTTSSVYQTGFTQLMRWGIFPVVCVFAVACLRALRGHTGAKARGVRVSVALTALGFVLGALIRGSNTVVPAHYHAAIGAVTAAFMTVTPSLLDRAGLPAATARARRWAAWQPVVYGGGQAVFAFGFALAGAHGTARKVYGAEQAGRGLAETIGLGVMGVGGLVAVAGGLLFLGLVLSRWAALLPHDRSLPWRKRATLTQSSA